MDIVNAQHKFGDVVNPNGDILVRNPTILNPDGIGLLTKGVVKVTEEQAEEAALYDWKVVTHYPQEGLVEIERGTASLKN